MFLAQSRYPSEQQHLPVDDWRQLQEHDEVVRAFLTINGIIDLFGKLGTQRLYLVDLVTRQTAQLRALHLVRISDAFNTPGVVGGFMYTQRQLGLLHSVRLQSKRSPI